MVTAKARLPREVHTSRPWRIHQIAPDFDVLDVWALPTPGGRNDFSRLVDVVYSIGTERSSPVVHALFAVRWALGRLFGWDDSTDGIGSRTTGLRERLPEDLASSFLGEPSTGRFETLYVSDDEAALEIANRTMHGVLHLGWVPDETGYRGQMAILVKPNGLFGDAYLAAIAPFRHLLVYPTMLRTIGRTWRDRVPAGVTVRQIDPPRDVRDLSMLPRVDYADTFVAHTVAAKDWTAERWARAVLEGASAEVQAKLVSSWTALGLKSVTASGSILGWEVRRASTDTLLIGRASRIGMPAELLFTRRPEGLLLATFIHHHTAATRPMWAPVEPIHVRTVRMLLEQAGHAAAACDVTE